MDPLSVLIFGVTIPAVLAGIVFLVGALRARAAPERPQPIEGALALGCAYAAAQIGLGGLPPVPAAGETLPFLALVFWMVVAAIALAPLRAVPFLTRFGNPFYRAFFVILPYHLIVPAGERQPAFDLAGIAAVLVVLGVWVALERLAARRSGPWLAASLWAACAGTALMLVANRSGVPAQFVGALAAGLGAAAVVALVVRGAHLASGAIAILVVAVFSLVRVGSIYDLPTQSAILVALAFVGPWVGEIPALRARSPWLANLAAFLSALLPALGAAWFAHAAHPPSPY